MNSQDIYSEMSAECHKNIKKIAEEWQISDFKAYNYISSHVDPYNLLTASASLKKRLEKTREVLAWIESEKLRPEIVYLDYVNNYLTVGYMAECYNMEKDKLEALIESGKAIHEMNVLKHKML